MIDFETNIFDVVADALAAYDPSVFVTSRPKRIPEQFPTVMVYENGNVIERNAIDTSGKELFSNLTYYVDVFTSNSKTQAKAIMQVVDEAFFGMNFIRTFCEPTENEERHIYRIVARYEGQVDGDGNLYRR